jgi:glutamate-5-semialdehyde dehydrogenase
MHDLVEMMIARGSSEFIRHVRGKSRIPVMAHADGICHLFLHDGRRPQKAATSPSTRSAATRPRCNSVETLLWEESAAAALDACVAALISQKVELRGCAETIKRYPSMAPPPTPTWDTEYCAPILSIKRVAGLDEALEPHRASRLPPHRRHRHRGHGRGGALPGHRRRRLRLPQRQHPLLRRLPLRPGGRGRASAPTSCTRAARWGRGPADLRWLLAGKGQATGDYGPGGRRFTHRDLPDS